LARWFLRIFPKKKKKKSDIIVICKIVSPIVVPPYPWRPWIEQNWFWVMSESIYVNFNFFCCSFLRRDLNMYKQFSLRWHQPTPGDQDSKKLNSGLCQEASM
jgi:hypothetical protein